LHRLPGITVRSTSSVLAAAAVALLFAACGGDAATRKDVIARGNAICSQSLASIRSVPPPAGASAPELAAYLKKVRPIIDHEASQLAALPRPSQSKATLDSFVAAFGATDRAYREAAAAAGRGDAAEAARALSTLRSSKVASLAGAYGLTDCTGTAATAP
jgi:hypothetical protein